MLSHSFKREKIRGYKSSVISWKTSKLLATPAKGKEKGSILFPVDGYL